MKTLSKSMLAVTGLALSLAACGPGLKGEGQKKPNLQRQLKLEAKLLKQQAEMNPNIKTIELGEADEDEILVEIKLDKADDVEAKAIAGIVSIDGSVNSQVIKGKVVDGKANEYTINLKCLDNCSKVAGVLETAFNVVQKSEGTEAVVTEKQDSESKDEELFGAQTGTTAPEAKPVVVGTEPVRTGIIVSATGQVLVQEKLDIAATIEQNIEVMQSMVDRMQPLGMIK